GTPTPKGCPNLTAHSFLNPSTISTTPQQFFVVQLKASSTIVPFSLHIMEPSLFSDFWPQCGQAASLQLALQENILSFKSKKQATTTKENQLIKKNTI
uniref:Uncharacterized protein n=1 Tax=Geospiza parvula TaxID=87175 RepID=A0A8C3MKG0_GEOPR